MESSVARKRLLGVAGVVAVFALGSGCGSSSDAEQDNVATSIDVITQVEGQLDEIGVPSDPGSLTCAEELQVETEAETTCEFVSEGQPVGLVTKVVEVDGQEVSIQVETEARPVPQGSLEERVRLQVERELDGILDSVACEGDLAAEVDATTACTLTAGDATRDVGVVVTSIDGGLIEFSIADG